MRIAVANLSQQYSTIKNDIVDIQETNLLSQTSSASNQIIPENRTAIYAHPDVINPFTSKLTPLQDDILGAYLIIIGESFSFAW